MPGFDFPIGDGPRSLGDIVGGTAAFAIAIGVSMLWMHVREKWRRLSSRLRKIGVEHDR